MGKKRRSDSVEEDEWGAGARALAAEQETGAGAGQREALCKHHLELLNRQFAGWVTAQLAGRPVKSWASGCRDYLKHINKIKADFKDVLETSTPTGNKIQALSKGSNQTANSFKPAAQPAPSLFAVPSTDVKNVTGSNTVPALSLGSSMPLFPTGSNPFSSLTPMAAPTFGGAPGAPVVGGMFANSKPAFDLAATPHTAAPDEEEEPQRPPSPSFEEKANDDSDIESVLFKVKCKFFTKKESSDQWADHGVNQLEFRKEKEPGDGNLRRSRIVCRNSIGKAVMNAGLYAQMSVQVTEKKSPDGSVKKNGIIVNLFNAVEDSVKQITLIRLGKESEVESLKKLFEENIAEMS